MSLASLTPAYLAAVEAELRRAVGAGPPQLQPYYEMLTYHLGWVDERGQDLPGGASGKRIRPLLCLLACAASGGPWERALPVAAAIELLHNFSLIHDDIQDNSPLRRGRPAVWTRWGRAQAINAGDAMFTLAHLAPHALQAQGVPEAQIVHALRVFDQTCLVLTQGQFLDMSFEARGQVGVDEYLEMIAGKTAALLSACTELGAFLAGAGPERVAHFREYGRSLGMAFQVQDDRLGIWGDSALTGKSSASDLEARKKSLPVLYGMQRSPEFAAAYAHPHTPGSSVAELVRQLEVLGARDFTRRQAESFSEDAVRHLEAARPEREAGRALRELTGQLLGRAW